MADIASELLVTCQVAEEIWEQAPERTTGLRAEIDDLWKAYELVLSSGGGENVDDHVIDMVALSAHFQFGLDHVPVDGVRTEALLATWRDADHVLSRSVPGTLLWLLACRALERARDAYHARVNAIVSPDRKQDAFPCRDEVSSGASRVTGAPQGRGR